MNIYDVCKENGYVINWSTFPERPRRIVCTLRDMHDNRLQIIESYHTTISVYGESHNSNFIEALIELMNQIKGKKVCFYESTRRVKIADIPNDLTL